LNPFIIFLSWACVDLLGRRPAQITPSCLEFEKESVKHSANLAPTPYYKFTQNARMPRRERKPRQKPSLNVERLLWARNAWHDLDSERRRYPSSHVLLRNSLEKRAWRCLFLLCPLNKAPYRVVHVAFILHLFESGYINPFIE